MRDHVFGHGSTSTPGSPDLERRTRKRKGKLKLDSKRTRRAFPEWWSEEDFASWSKGKKGFSKAFQKAMNAFRKVGFRTHQPEEGAGKDFLHHEGRGGKGGAYPQSGLSASETTSEEGFCHAWESDDWSSSHWPDESSTSAAGWSCTSLYCMDGGSCSEPGHFFSGSTHRSAGGGLVSRPAANNRMYANSCLLGCFNSPRQAEVASVAASSSACRQIHLTRDFFLDTFILVHTSHCDSRCRTTCLHKKMFMHMSSHV